MRFVENYKFRSYVKGKIAQFCAAFEYGTNHPYVALCNLARDSTVAFILKNCPRAIATRTPIRLMDIALDAVTLDGLYLEFGVFRGQTINYIAKKSPDKQLHGFDSFKGLPEAWASNPEGTFTTHGKLPKVPNNVQLWAGYFEDSLPPWCEKHNETAAFVHIDCDLRSSTQTVMDALGTRIKPGTVILFDDYFNFPGWEEDGHAVFTDFLKQHNLGVKYVGYSFKELAVIITEPTTDA